MKDKHGNSYYKIENGVFYVDSAIKGFDFLPPSWKRENIKAAMTVLNQICTCIANNYDMGKMFESIGENIHNEWVARQVADITGQAIEKAKTLGTLTKDELEGKEDTTQKHTRLYNAIGKDKLNEIWGVENFVGFKELPFNE